MIPDEAIEAAANAMAPVVKKLEATFLAQAALEAAAPFLRAQALEDAADELVWVRPDRSPCESFEACCGSEDSCDAMNPSTSVVGEHWLRARAATERGEARD